MSKKNIFWRVISQKPYFYSLCMVRDKSVVKTITETIKSKLLLRDVQVDFYLPENIQVTPATPLLLINDGQDLIKMKFDEILDELYSVGSIQPVCFVGIHCGTDRRNEYGTVGILDYKGRGAKAGLYEKFVFIELMPLIYEHTGVEKFFQQAFCGFSLGGLTAIDLVWRHPDLFQTVGVFSGSLWWRTLSQDHEDFDEENHRIMHQKIRAGNYAPHLRFFFETGTLDEVADRNSNGIIDSIDDTISLIAELQHKGYPDDHIAYLELKDGRHDVTTWGRAFPYFLKWAWPA